MRVLIVDDVLPMLRTLEVMLERNKFEPVRAKGGAEALEILTRDFRIDAVVCSLAMRKMSGIELLHKAKRVERFTDAGMMPPPPFLLLTMFGHSGSGQSCKTELQDAYEEFAAIVQKPVSEPKLISALRNIDVPT